MAPDTHTQIYTSNRNTIRKKSRSLALVRCVYHSHFAFPFGSNKMLWFRFSLAFNVQFLEGPINHVTFRVKKLNAILIYILTHRERAGEQASSSWHSFALAFLSFSLSASAPFLSHFHCSKMSPIATLLYFHRHRTNIHANRALCSVELEERFEGTM